METQVKGARGAEHPTVTPSAQASLTCAPTADRGQQEPTGGRGGVKQLLVLKEKGACLERKRSLSLLKNFLGYCSNISSGCSST